MQLAGYGPFGPLNLPSDIVEPVIMTVDEYETIRLIDLEGVNSGRVRPTDECGTFNRAEHLC